LNGAKILGPMAACTLGTLLIIMIHGEWAVALWAAIGIMWGLYAALILVNRVEQADIHQRRKDEHRRFRRPGVRRRRRR
jgi:hypothetical protein